MSDKDEQDSEATEDEDTEVEEQVATRNKQKRAAELKAELADLEGSGPVEDTAEGSAEEISDDVEEAAEDIAKDEPDDKQEVEAEAEDAAEEIAASAKRQGVTFTDQEIDGIARRIASKVEQILKEKDGKDETAPARRRPDRRPRGTHFSERQMFGKRGS